MMQMQSLFSVVSTLVLSQSVWLEVPKSQEYSLGNQKPWYIEKTIKRNKDKVEFKAFSSSDEYISFEGDCNKNRLRVVFLGQFNSDRQIEYQLVPSRLWHWYKAKDMERKVLEFACSR